MTIVLKNNNEAIRKKIADGGIELCQCTMFYGACWLNYNETTKSVHGLGYPFEGMTQEETLAQFEYECKDPCYCKDVNEFINKIKDYVSKTE